jgi:general secretion pathway protein D
MLKQNMRSVLNLERCKRIGVLVLALLVFSGCAAQKAYQQAERELKRRNFDQAVLAYSKAVAMDPGNTRYSVALERARLKASAEHFSKGKRFFLARQWELAIAEFQQTLLMNPGNQHAKTELNKAALELRKTQVGLSEFERLKARAKKLDLGPPKLDPRANIPILLNFQEREVGKIFEAISKASGINFIYDEKVDLERPRTIDVGNVTLEKALDILMLQTKNFYKVIDEYTLLIAPDTRQKRQEYEDQVIRTFFLSNAETKTVVTLLRSLLQSRQIAENADLNSVTIKDTPSKVAIAERIIMANDKSKGEVLIDVELLEINRSLSQTLGLDLTSKTLSLTFRGGDQSLPLNGLDALKQAGSWTVGVIPSVVLSFLRSDSDTKAIAKPQLRVAEGERAELLIGDRVPIPTTSFNTSNTVGTNVLPITSFTYQNVGLNLQIEPRVHHNKEVTLQIQIEISQITGQIESTSGSQPIIGTRQIQTVIRLRDGETNMLAGLISRADVDSHSGLPGFANIPGIRNIFGSHSKSVTETDIILTLTPRIVRIPDITEDDLVTLWVGTEDHMRLRGDARNALATGPFGAPPDLAPVDNQVEVPPLMGRGAGNISRAGSTSTDPEPPSTPDPATDRPVRNDERSTSPPPAQTPVLVPPLTPADAADRDRGDEDSTDEQPQQLAVVSLVPSKSSYRVGEAVIVNVLIQNGQNVGSVPYHLRYNSQVLQFNGPATEGGFLTSGGVNTVFLASDTGGGGEIVVGHSRMGGGQGASGGGTLGTFQFTAIGPGDCGFVFTGASVKDTQAGNLPAAFNAAAAQVQP